MHGRSRRRLGTVRARLTVLLAATLAVLTLTAAPARAAQPAAVVGIGEQKSGMFASRQWKRLGVRDARYTVPWDALQDPYQLALLDTWFAAAKRAHVRALIGFGHSLRSIRRARILPTQRQFERQFKRFRARYPWVRAWLAWNEANNPGALTAGHPRRAAEYFDAVARNCRDCRIVAADVLDTRNMASWVRSFLRYAHATPQIWGLHNYGDANGMSARGTQTLLALTRGQIWFTETGGVVLRRLYNGRRVIRTYRYSLEHAAQSTAHILRLTCLSRRIARVYLYHWRAPLKVTSWDSGLLDRRGRPRPAYWVLHDWLARRANAAAGLRREGCRAPAGRLRARSAQTRPNA